MRFVGTGLLAIPNDDSAPGAGNHVRIDSNRVFVDTRRVDDGELPESAKVCQLKEPAQEDIKHSALFIDLGSTRTLGLVVPDKLADWEKMECRTLDLVDYAGGNDEGPAPFSSQVVLERRPEGVGAATWPLSEVRTGKAAAELYLYGASEMAGTEGRGVQLMASSPKRMIARNTRERTWRTIGRGHEPPFQCYFDSAQKGSARAEGLIPSRLVGMQVVELVEQAERMLNSREETHAYRVDEVHVTYPPGWLGPVQEAYQRIIQTEVDRWARDRALEVKVHVGCSEALGALLFHWYNRRLRDHRRDGGHGTNLDGLEEILAVVDVGGGTSDLLIEKIDLNQHVYEFKPVRWQSEETAGDELVRRVAVEVVLPTLIKECYQIGEYAALLDYLRDDAYVTEKRLWLRRELLPLAQCFTQAAERGELPAADNAFVRSHLEKIVGKLDAVVGTTARDGDKISLLIKSIPKTAQAKVPQFATEIFKPLAESFASICKRHGCSEVMLSGKAMEYAAVKDVFEKAFDATGVTNGLLVGQQIADDLQGFLRCQTVWDSKFATVWGSICKWLLKENRGHFVEGWGISILEVVGWPSWYLHGLASRLTRADCAGIAPVQIGEAKTVHTLPMALSYVAGTDGQNLSPEQNGAVPVRMYKLAFKDPSMRLAPGSRPQITLRLDSMGRFQVSQVAAGRVVQTTRTGEFDLQVNHLEVSLALDYATNSFWLDSGIVELPHGSIGAGSGDEGLTLVSHAGVPVKRPEEAEGRPRDVQEKPVVERPPAPERRSKPAASVKLEKSKKK